jgi:hypothetical protein
MIPTENRVLDSQVTPHSCTETRGKDVFVPIPNHRKRYRVVLELFRTEKLDERLALLETPIFRG